ncbi:MAG: archease [Anaerolineales bacterium]|nr:archease [Anaerolineales bacterium]
MEHTADLAIKIQAPDFQQLLDCASHALHNVLSLAFTSSDEQEQGLKLAAPDRESLLVRWVEEQLYLIEVEGRAWRTWSLDIPKPNELVAVVQTASIAPLERQIKAVTFHNLEIHESAHGLETVLVFDV